MLLPYSGGIDVAAVINGDGRNLFLRGAIQDKALPARRDPVDKAAAVGAREQIPIEVQSQHADVGFVALEEERRLPFGSHAENLAVISGSDEQVACVIQSQVPDVLGVGIEIEI